MEAKELTLLKNFNLLRLKEEFNKTFIDNTTLIIDLYAFFVKSLSYGLTQIISGKTRSSYRLKDSNQGFYFEYLDSNYLY
jgi:hypothetical protein